MKRPNKFMVDYLNLKLKEEGTCLRYIEKHTDSGITSYQLQVVDKYVDCGEYYTIPFVSKEFEDMVRTLFKKYGAKDIGFTNTVATILVVD